MNCNSRLPGVAPVVLRFNYEAHAKSTYPFLSYNVFTADNLRHAVTLTLDPLIFEHLIFEHFNASVVT